ncbi:MAG: hypothetical protein HY906_02995 [Deltaproteobacteria bacterium]|nr:hypothetical protein [Deltaproteobacteria bacterium]
MAMRYVHRRGAVKTITFRNVPPQVAREVEKRAARAGVSLNRALVDILEEATGHARARRRGPRYHDLDALAGTWSAEEAREFDAALAEQRTMGRAQAPWRRRGSRSRAGTIAPARVEAGPAPASARNLAEHPVTHATDGCRQAGKTDPGRTR